MKRALLHRYDNSKDIKAASGFGCSEVYDRSQQEDFDIVIIVPTLSAKSNEAIVADATSGQIASVGGVNWPGRAGPYQVRINLTNFRPVTASRVRILAEKAGIKWAAQWKVNYFEVDEAELLAPLKMPKRI